MTHDLRLADLDHPSVQTLLALHFRAMHDASPPGTAYVLDLSGLRRPDITVWAVWHEDQAIGLGALKALAPDHGEVKSMRTHPDALGQGVGSTIIEHIIAEAKARGMTRLSLETGYGAAFEPALNLYRRRGFVQGQAFADYRPSDFNQFLHLDV